MKFQPLFHSFFLFYLYTTSISCLSSKHRDIHHNRYKLKHNRNHNHNHNHNQNYSGDLPGCDFCEEILTELDNFLAVNTTWDDIQDIADAVCLAVLAGGNCVPPFYDWQCTEVCKQSVYEFSNEVQFLVIQYIDPALLCYSIGFDCPVPPPTPEPTPIPDILEDNMARNASGIGYIVQIPDIHVDPWAKPYTVANCGMPVCCRESDDNHSYPNATYGGYYGSYLKCDASPLVVESMWDFIKKNITHKYGDDIDFAIWVGDAVPHDVNNQSRWTHLQILKNTNQDLKKTFGGLSTLCICLFCVCVDLIGWLCSCVFVFVYYVIFCQSVLCHMCQSLLLFLFAPLSCFVYVYGVFFVSFLLFVFCFFIFLFYSPALLF